MVRQSVNAVLSFVDNEKPQFLKCAFFFFFQHGIFS